MKRLIIAVIVFLAALCGISCFNKNPPGCLTGAFLADNPDAGDIIAFQKEFGKRPYLVMVFVGWNKFIAQDTVSGVYAQKSALFITWEPWDIVSKKGVPLDEIASGQHDVYIRDFAEAVKNFPGSVFIRFAHEVNGDWYPWSGIQAGSQDYVAASRHVRDVFVKTGALNAAWVFSVNWEDIPKNNGFAQYYPGEDYVDYIGIDGYNWGNTRSWSKWMSFKEIFDARIKEIKGSYKKPVIISEFSSASSGGDKARWIKEALKYIKNEKNIKAFVLFSADKEADWSFSGGRDCGKELKKQLSDPYFAETAF